MKKIIKWSLIIGLVICLLGVGMITAGAMMGGGIGLVSYLENHHYTSGWYGDGGNWDNGRFFADSSDHLLDEVRSYEDVRKLEIEGAIGSIELVEEKREDPNDQAVKVARFSRQENARTYYEIVQDREELKIELRGRYRDIRKEDVESLTIYVPEGYHFRQVEVEISGGGFYADVLYADEADLSLRAGEIVIGRGDIVDLDVECAAGYLECGAQVSRHTDVECQAGSVNILLAGTKDQYNYELECKVGTITLAGDEEESYTGLRQKKYIDHRAANKVELECAAGEITVDFSDSI